MTPETGTTIAQSLLPEFDHEVTTTRSLLERIPEAEADWKPHEKSMSLGQLAAHITDLVKWAAVTVTTTEFDVAPPDGESFTPPVFESTARLLGIFDENVRATRAAIGAASDTDLMISWSLKKGGATLFTMPRVLTLRTFVMNHMIHHRGQLSVYLRLKDVPLPSIYGPTADTAM